MSPDDPHRRVEFHESALRPVTLLGRGGDAADSARDFLERNAVSVRWFDLDRDPLAAMLCDEELDAASIPLMDTTP